jgi:hypothetical protein
MTEQELQVIEERWAKWINPKSAPKTLGGDFLILLAEVRRLNEENENMKLRWEAAGNG